MYSINIKSLYFLFSILLFFTSCEKEIDLNLDENEPLFVVEAIVHDSLGDNFVKISMTKPFKDNSPITTITNANVVIKDNFGNTFNFYQTTNGYYTDSTLQGFSGRTYNLYINIDGVAISATSTMPVKVNLDSLSYEQNTEAFWEDPNIPEYSVRCHFSDPLNSINYYRFKAFLRGVQEDGFQCLNDDLIDGLTTYYPIFGSAFYENDSINVQFLSIDEFSYKYFTALTASQGGQVPGNPETNLKGAKSVGYFGAFAKSEKNIIIK
ncbi:MAG: DUF4249 domain-containing protein [Vicingaceae bacterium]|nr:DUF4249 domain-containing protein [Vicingaceae bacterium]